MRSAALATGFACLMAVAVPAGGASPCSAWFTINTQDGTVAVTALCSCSDPGPVEYRLSVKSSTTGGTANNTQSGTRVLEKDTPRNLATLNLVNSQVICYDIALDIFRDGQRIAAAREISGNKGG